jgi:HD-GYP domain-containing protein (c-di-GMP phosphodiesterase class II)
MERRKIAELEDRGHPAFSPATADLVPGSAGYVYTRTSGVPLVSVVVPILPRSGAQLGWVSGVFAVTDEAVAEANARILRRILISVGIVLATVLVVYPIIARLVGKLQRAGHKLLDSNLDSIAALGSAIAKKDSDTDVHNYRVTIYAARLGEAAGLERRAMCALMKGAFLHDVGKIGIRDAVLLKPGRLDEAEFAEMRMHVDYGLEIVRQSSWLQDAADVVGGHHEKFDGSGYPLGLRGEAIPIGARIFALADVFDALTSRRPYKAPMSYDAALAILEKGRGSHFDPRLLDEFSRIARPLFDEFGNRDDDKPRAALRSLIDQYFKPDAAILMA